METIHIFEQAGLGKAPYEYLYCTDSKASCQFCNTNIRYKFFLKSADNKIFFVGSDCIYKSGDRGLTKIAKTERSRIAKEQRQAKRQKQYEERQAKREAEKKDKLERFFQNHQSIKNVLDWASNSEGLPKQIYDNLNTWGTLTDKQCDLLCKLHQETTETKTNCPQGEMTLQGTVQSIKYSNGFRGELVPKMTVKVNGFRVFGTIPVGIRDVNVGDCVKFDAYVAPSEEDPYFGFFSRPTRGSVVEENQNCTQF